MKFSIIMPVYNTEKYVETAILSVVNQTYSNYELICINDGSTDKSAEILSKFVHDKQVQILQHEENKGLLAARITGVKYATGDYVLFLDSDDWFENHILSVLAAELKNNSYDYIEFSYYQVKNRIKKRNVFSKADTAKNIHDILLSNANHTIWNKCFDVAFLKEIYTNLPDFYSVFSEDYYQMAIIEYHAKTRKRIRVPLYNYRLDSGITNTNNFNNIEKIKLIDLSLDNVYYNLAAFFKSEQHEDYLPYIEEYNKKQYVNVLKATTSTEVITIIKNRIGEEGLFLLLIKEINELNNKVNTMRPGYKILCPLITLLKPLVNIIRCIKNSIQNILLFLLQRY